MTADIDGHDVARHIAAGEAAPRPLFIPIIFSVGSQMEAIDYDTYLSDPTKIANALQALYNYHRYDGILTYLNDKMFVNGLEEIVDVTQMAANDPTEQAALLKQVSDGVLETEPFSVASTVADKLRNQIQEPILLTGYVPGPVTVTSQLLDENVPNELDSDAAVTDLFHEVSQLVLSYIRNLGQTGDVNALIVSENTAAADVLTAVRATDYLSLYWRNITYYNQVPLLKCRFDGADFQPVRDLRELGFELIIGEGTFDVSDYNETMADDCNRFVWLIDPKHLYETSMHIALPGEDLVDRVPIVMTAGEVQGHDLETLNQAVPMIARRLKSLS